MMHFQLSPELENEIRSASKALGIEPAEWVRLAAVESGLRIQAETPDNQYVRATSKPGGTPGQYVKPDAEHVHSTIESARQSIKHANAHHSQPVAS